jgi:CRP/FNR family transcriptional regulator, dissimilatory nitrate respiration regulator
MGRLPATLRESGLKRELKSGQTLFKQGDPSAVMYEVVAGMVRFSQVDAKGREIVLGFAYAGDFIGAASLFSEFHLSDAVAAAKTVVRIYRKSAVLTELDRNPAAARAFMALLIHRIKDLRTRLERRCIHSARDRVRHYLTNNVRAADQTFVLPGTLKDWAAELDLTHEALYRTLSEMQALGEIARHNSLITITRSRYDRDHLHAEPRRILRRQGAA